ncbi:hypothetical protein PC116_g7801 [Phytophthora cactorum]|uniref:Fucolectin tachylectin-4 pentraxin-1 domain-containing protein n=3 Tax=Phytophthora cactorum TaxID=29920 RepID=A0A329RYR5_9STRA|nr:hypothetical protein Pcac1_g20167 [Phytophthora cactorum]KAG2822142.1 hypothetical protein PC112_g11064 [Phytophthora cactorum]KAG2824523.1 hypothetical protein PC111_g9790 [Phytophthora cactorum]KAG2952124.1 hypothetical protein PC117_g3062 [Phytophthora cactorum]KAG3165144.1 hypothetical protein C6341_g12465 [Phytophthora cactorum]
MVWHDSRWMHTRVWCGALPSYHLLSQDEVELEKRISKVYFDSFRFADLRMQIRIKLKELPQPLLFANPVVYWDILELLDEYLPLLLSIQRYHLARHYNSSTLPCLLSTFPPLFYGFGELNLLTDRLVGRQRQAKFSIAVELVLVLCSMGQLNALYAETQIVQGGDTLTITSWPRLQHAELSWQSAESFYRWAASYSSQNKGHLDSNDSLTGSIWRFFNAMASTSASLARMCSTHRLSTHIAGLALTEMRPERLFRIGSVIARRALTLVREAKSDQSDQRDTRFSQQLKWCLSAYEIRWTAIYYQCELEIFRLDAIPEIAIYFCECILKLRIPPLASISSQQQDVAFTQFAHEIQLKHQTQVTEALDEKKTLLHNCRSRFGMTWAFQAIGESLSTELLTIREMGPVFSQEQRFIDTVVEEEENNYVSPFLVEVIAASVDQAISHGKADDPESDLSKECEIIVTNKPQERQAKPVTQGLMECHIVTAKREPGSRIEPKRRDQEAKSSTQTSSSEQLEKRPSSATSQGSGWVTMNYGGKLLHFEKTLDPPAQRKHLSGTIRRSKPRPSSSPCYLSSKKTPKPHHGHSASSSVDHTKMWRAPCALCERRFMRSSLPGVVVMKRIFDLRRKWGIIQNSRKINSPSVLYGTANVCLQCQEILTHEEIKQTPKTAEDKAVVSNGTNLDKDVEVTRMIHDSILYQWHQQPPTRSIIDNSLEDIAANKRVRQSSTVCSMKAQNALDPDTNRSAHTKEEFQPWWEIDLANYVEVHSVKVYLRDEVSHLYAAARGNPSRQTTRVYPLHISISMKSGVGRDYDDIVAGCVSSMCVPANTGPLIEFIAPQKARGRFVRVQCQGRAILHIERVNVYVAKSPLIDPVERRQHFRQKLQRAAYCASVLATTATPLTGSNRVAVAAEPSPKRRMSAIGARNSRRRSSQTVMSKTQSEPQFAAALFFDPERAEKKRISKLYTKFKSLLDARAKYIAPDKDLDVTEVGAEGETHNAEMNGSG